MKFELTDEQRGFAQALTDLMRAADSVAVARAWAGGDPTPGQDLWKRLADQGVTALVAPEDDGGLGGTLVDLVVAFEVLGHELAVGPWIESAALAPQVDGAMVTAAAPPVAPYAADAHVARLLSGTAGAAHASVDPTRTLVEVTGADPFDPDAVDRAVLACSAELLGAGERVLADSVTYAKQRASSAARSGRTRRSSTSWPMSGSPWTSPARWSSAPLSARCRSRRPRSRPRTPPTWRPAPASRSTARSATPPSSTSVSG